MIAGLYIHIPFCIKKCNYCDFVSIPVQSCMTDYIHALLKEIHLKSRSNFQVDTIYFGGGTPSILNPKDISCICQRIHRHWQIQENPEITIEVNPGTLSHDKLLAWKALGINRINLGVQSFHDYHLQQLGRIHNAEEADQAIRWLKEAGFQNIGLDLMYGLPNQTLKEWQKDLYHAISYKPQHLSCYSLTYEPGTPLYQKLQNKMIKPLSEITARQMMRTLFQTMSEQAYEHYEISNFAASPEFRSQHNQRYWQRKPYIGLGAGAHSFLENKRLWNCSDVEVYINKISNQQDPIENFEYLTIEQQIIEFIFLGLRQKEGINMIAFDTKFPYCFKNLFYEVLHELESVNYLEISSDFCRLSDLGKFYLDSICQRFVQAI